MTICAGTNWAVAGHPFVKTPNIDRIAREGAIFRNAFVTTPLCSPSRASFLTGQYAHTHGITDNVDRSAASHKLVTFPLLLHQSGYETAFIGKWHMGNDDTPRPGFDRWVSFKGQGTYLDPDINEDGRAVKPKGYITDILNGYAVEFIKRRHDKPFLIYLAHKAIHPEVTQNNDGSVNLTDAERFIPAERHQESVRRQDRSRAGRTTDARRMANPPCSAAIGSLPPLGPATATRDEAILGRQRSLMAIEEGVGEILQALERDRPTRQHGHRLHQRQRLLLRRARPERRAAAGLRRVDPHAAARALSRRPSSRVRRATSLR